MLGRLENNLVSAEVSVNRVGFQSCVINQTTYLQTSVVRIVLYCKFQRMF